MAITKTIEIDVNSQGATSGINNITNSIEQTDKATQSLRSQLRQAQADVAELSDKFGATSKEAIEAAKRAGELKDAIGDAKALTDAFNPDAKFSALSGSLAGVASGFSAVEGSLALAGVQSENLQETMVRLQAAMALSQGLQGLGESIDSFKQMGAVAKNALAGIRTGIAATGIGLLLVAVGAVAVYWDDIKEAVGGVSTEQEKLNVLSQKNLDTEQGKLDAVSSQDNVLKLQGKSEKDILKIKIAQTDQVIKATENQIAQNDITAKAQIAAAQRNKDILKGVLDFLTTPLKVVLQTIDSIGSVIGKDFGLAKGFNNILDKGASLLFDPIAETKKADEVRKESLKTIAKLKNDRAGLQLSLNDIDKQAAQTNREKQKENNDKTIKLEQDKADALERIRQGEIDTEAERRAEELRQVQKQYADLIAEAEKYYGLNSEKVLSLRQAQKTKEKELQDKFDKEDADKKLTKEQEENNYWIKESEKSIARDEAAKKSTEDVKKLKDEEIEKENQLFNAKADFANQGLNLIQEVAGKGSKIGKAAAIAQTVISGIQGVQNAYTTAQKSPITALFPAYPIVQAGLAGVFSALQIAKIKSASASGSSGGGSVSGGGGSIPSMPTAAPQFNVVGAGGVNQLASTLGNQQPVQAFVVANQVTSQQALDRNIISNASIG